jgi:radical SAM superfamily enzyme YgiQ (UPF0313 family)
MQGHAMNPSPPISRVNFIEYNAKVGTIATGAILPKYGTPLMAAIIREHGYQVRLFLEEVSEMDFDRMIDCDLVCFPVYWPALNKIKDCVERIRREKPDLSIVMGGPQAGMFPRTLEHMCDYLVRSEGDEILPALIECLSSGGDLREVKGITFRDNGNIVRNPDAPPPEIPRTAPDYTLIEGFEQASRGFGGQPVVNTLQTSRGCKFKCKFCPTSKLFGGVYRNRDIDSIIREIRVKKRFNNSFLVVDNSFLSNRKRTIELLHRLIEEDLGAVFIVFERHEIGRDNELLQLMWQAGVRCIIVGIESLEDENLQQYNKQQTSHAVIESVRNIQRNNIHVLGTFVLGGDGDTRDRAERIIEFVNQTSISLNLFIMHDWEEDESKGLMIPNNRRFWTYYQKTDPDNTDWWDYLTGSFVTYFPKNMKPSTLQGSMIRIYSEVFSHKNNLRRIWSPSIFNSTFGVVHGYEMKHMNDTIMAPVNAYYMDLLREYEQGLYDDNEVLIEEKLDSIERLRIPRSVEPMEGMSPYSKISLLATLPGLVRLGIARLRRKLDTRINGRSAGISPGFPGRE